MACRPACHAVPVAGLDHGVAQWLSEAPQVDVQARKNGRLVAALPCFIWQDGVTGRLIPAAAGISD